MTTEFPINSPKSSPTLIQLALKNKILTREQINQALVQVAEQQRNGKSISLEDYLLEMNLVSKDTLSKLVAATVRHLDKQFGQLAVQYHIVDETHVAKALDVQKQAFANGSLRLVGDILMEWNLLTAAQRDELLDKLPPTEPANTPSQPVPERPSKPAAEPEAAELDDEALTIAISDHDQKAILRIPGNLKKKPDIQTVKSMLTDLGIIFGIIDDGAIDDNLSRSGREAVECILASGIPGVPPKDAQVKHYFTTEYLNPGKITEDGSIDFRERGAVPFVQSGTLLAEKIPGVDGKPGTNIFGQPIPATKANDQNLKSGSGTQASDDGLKVFASMDGQPFITVHGEVSVFKELHIPGDVDYTTGNIAFDGSIIVKGSIKPGFTVKGGSLIAKEISGAIIDVKGNIDISGGIADSVISLGGNLQAMFMTGSKVDAYGDILIKKEIIDSKIRTSGACTGDQVNLISSFISARKGIQVKRVGTDVSRPCTLRVGISDHTNKKINNLKALIDENKSLLEAAQKKVETLVETQKELHQQVMEKSIIQDRLNQQKKNIEDKIKEVLALPADDPRRDKLTRFLNDAAAKCDLECQQIDAHISGLFSEQDVLVEDIIHHQNECEPYVLSIEDLNIQIREIRNWEKKSRGMSLIRVSQDIYAQTSVSGLNSTLILKETRKNVSIRETKNTDPANPNWEMVIESN